ncbi:hypothetical protein HMPREF1432_00939 [Helicobacter pylori GAMchJs114i]|nr:hypothetical protein HMPREF1432_00939 [Helicobacter pylori GAMchJs114i]
MNSNKKPLKLKIFKKITALHSKKEISRYNIFAFAIFSFHGKLLFRIYPYNHVYGGVGFTTIFSNLKTLSQKPLKSKITLQDELFCDFR